MNKSKLSVRKNPKRKKKDIDTIDLDNDEIYRDLKDELVTIKSMLQSLLDENKCLKSDIASLKSMIQKINSGSSNTSVKKNTTYADKLKNSEPVLLIVPKDTSQNYTETKSDLIKNISPTKISVDTVRKAANGAIVVQCKDQESSNILKTSATDKLSDKYDIKTPAQRNTRLKIVNISEKPNDEGIVAQIKKQNTFVPETATIKVVKTMENTRYTNTNYTVIIETDTATYNEIIKHEKLSIGWDRCRVFEHIYITRCYRCLGFNHSSKVCTKKQACIKCGGEHERKDCTSADVTCINCANAVMKLDLTLDVKHEAYSSECTVWKRRVERERNRQHTTREK